MNYVANESRLTPDISRTVDYKKGVYQLKGHLKKILAVVLSLCLMLPVMSITSQAAGTQTVSVGTVTAAPGETITVPVTVSGGISIGCCSYNVLFDSSALTYVSYSFVDTIFSNLTSNEMIYVNDTLTSSYGTNAIRVSYVSSAAGRVGTGTLMYLTFKVKNAASNGNMAYVKIGGDNIKFYDEANQLITNNFVDGGVSVSVNKTLSFETNGGDPISSITKTYGSTIDTLPTPTKVGYNFLGWYADSVLTTAVTVPYTFNQDATIYAKWARKSCAVSFVTNGGAALDSISVLYGDKLGTLPGDTKTGYKLQGWFTDVGLTTAATADTVITADTTLYASWKANTYTVTYETNGGSALSSTSADYGATIATSPVTTKYGYDFGGWFTDAAMTAANMVSFPYIVGGDVTFYAKWTPKTYTVTFDSKGGSDVAPVAQSYNMTIAIPTCTKVGNTIEGWYSDPSLTTKVAFPYTVTGDVTLYAKWTLNQYTITYNVDGGSPISNATVDYGTKMDTAPVTTKTGYTFGGWYSDPGLTSTVVFPYTVSTSATFYAKWTVNKYTVTFNSNGGSAVDNMSVTYNTAIGTLPTSTLAGSTFGGWYSDSQLTKVVTAATVITADITLYAKFTVNQYTVTYDSNSGTSVDAATVDYGTKITSAPAPTRTGFTLAGWYSDSALTSSVAFPYTVTASVTLYAKWTPNMYAVIFNTNGGSPVSSLSLAYNTQLLTAPTSTKYGYALEGWYSDSALTNKVAFPYTVTASDVTFYAKWTAVSCTITLMDGTGKIKDVAVNLGDTISTTFDANKDGYVLAGWYSDAALTQPVNFPYTVTGNATVFAKYFAKGDYDMDGNVTILDARSVIMVDAGVLTTSTPLQLQICDMDGDGSLTVLDSKMILVKAISSN